VHVMPGQMVVRGGVEPPTFRFSGALSRLETQEREPFRCPAQSHYRWSAAIEAIVATVPGYAAEFRLVCGISVGITGRGRTCGDSVGPPRAAAGSSAILGEPGGQSRP